MGDYRTLNRTILCKVESTPGTDATPVVGTDAVLGENPSTTPGIQALNTNEVTGALDTRAPIPGGGPGNHSLTVNLHGSGAGGTAPEWGSYMRACAFAQTLLAADITGTASAGATGSITLDTGDGATVEIGHIITLTGGTGSGQTRVVTGVSTDTVSVYPNWSVTPSTDSVYAVKASALYVPASSSLVTASIYDYYHASSGANSELRKVLGWVGNAAFNLGVGGIGQVTFTGLGKWATPANVSPPGAATFDSQRPVPFMNADVSLDSVAVKINALTFDMGNQVQQAPDPADTYGVDVGGITRRQITGRINPPLDLLSVRNVFADFIAGTPRSLWVRYGAAGNGVSVYFPNIVYTGREDEDVNGFLHEGIPFGAVGEDSGVYINVY